jgi:hypothetical protein
LVGQNLDLLQRRGDDRHRSGRKMLV